VKIQIKNWKKFNPRSDLKTMPWFRVSSSIVFDRKLYGLVPEQKWLWICLLAIAAQENSSEIELDFDYLSHHAGVQKKHILQAVDHFEKMGLLSRSRDGGVTEPSRTCPESVLYERNERNVTNKENTSYSCRKSGAEKMDNAPFDEILSIWNEHRGDLPKVISLSTKRKQTIKTRLKEEPDLRKWEIAVKALASSPWHSGKTSSNGWKANFDFFLRPDTILKAVEGAYSSRPTLVDNKRAEKDKILDGIM